MSDEWEIVPTRGRTLAEGEFVISNRAVSREWLDSLIGNPFDDEVDDV